MCIRDRVDGLTPNIIKQAFEKCRVARYGILDEIMLKAIPQPREDVSDWAPKMTTIDVYKRQGNKYPNKKET